MTENNFNLDKIKINIWKYFLKYVKPYKQQFIIISAIMVFLGILDASFPLMTKYAIDNFVEKGSINGLGNFSIVYFLLVATLSITVYLFISMTAKVEAQMAYDIRKIGFEKLQFLPLSYYDENAVGWIMARMTSDINRLSETISWSLVDFSWGISMMTAVTVAMLKLNFKLAIITLSIIPFLAIVSFYFQKKILTAQRGVRKINSQITAAYNEDIQGAKTTKTLVREEINLEEFSEITRSMKNTSIRATMISSIYLPIVLTLASVGTALALSFGGNAIMLNLISYGTLVVFISYATQLYEPVRQLAVIFSELQSAQASAERVFSLLNEVPDILDSPEVVKRYGDLLSPKRELWPEIKGSIEFKNISFSYKEGEIILDNFNLKVNAGETIALVGETGSGKSTIVNLFCRFYEPTKGKILIDGINYKDMPQNWIHENLGYVLQSPHLFSGTIKENIAYGSLESSDDEIIHASKLVDAHSFIMETEKGYDTQVGEGGGLLSTGQKQLISFARAVVRNPKLFVLDEATSSIDTETEQIIQDAIHKVLDGRTSFVIAHRLSTIRNADRILLIRDGKIQESGKHEELLKIKGYYYNLYTSQFIEEKSMNLLD